MNTQRGNVSRIPILITAEAVGKAKGELIRFQAPLTVGAILKSMPFEGRAGLHHKEVYVETPLRMGNEKPRKFSDKGMIAYWPVGRAFCIFLEKTRPYSSINPIGRILDNLEMFRNVSFGTKITVEQDSFKTMTK